ncbi:hypothetical protein JTB14_037921 [Gonioctena quinquepunctata]|nr:hypothetical protein JTB14_037921 [Gonioctena quinquepunctata]
MFDETVNPVSTVETCGQHVVLMYDNHIPSTPKKTLPLSQVVEQGSIDENSSEQAYDQPKLQHITRKRVLRAHFNDFEVMIALSVGYFVFLP